MGKLKHLLCLLTLSLVQLGICSGLQCYVCSSSKSWEDCAKIKTASHCPVIPSADPRCFKVEKKYSVSGHSTFAAGCVSSHMCTTNSMCNNTTSCQFNCCNQNLCNFSRENSVYKGMFTALVAAAISLAYTSI